MGSLVNYFLGSLETHDAFFFGVFRGEFSCGLYDLDDGFSGEKIEGIGKTRKEAQHRAAESSLKYLANKYLSLISLDPNALQGEYSKLCHSIESGSVRDPNSFGYPIFPKDDTSQIAKNSNQLRFIDQRFDGFKNSVSSVATLKELCTLEGLSLRFTERPSLSTDSGQKGEIFAQVEIGEQVLGKGIGSTWDEAKEQAAEEALGRIQYMLGQKRIGSPRLQANLYEHSMPKFSRVLQRTPSSDRYYKNGVSIP
ncbi:RNA polymerase II C-terminal domain phosphatase-like 1 [Acorus calamus]|uniref:RNA polymerase II C-terminal domain phosphatase-like 1 n=1 Tax=Acorus calamus TaxID=4465 RepID=A0AAV9EIR0_ACOCL|nr:RNA polymerase II C-terminal domain phosphatase-like 1 [Acorus calamus]